MKGGKGKCLAGALVAGVALVGVANAGSAATVCLLDSAVCPGTIEFEPDANVSPGALPRWKPATVAFSGHTSVSTSDGSHPPALREAVLEVDRDVAVDAEGLPACGYRQIASRDSEGARQSCRKALVGQGEAVVELAYPENTPIPIRTEVGLFNGGVRDGVTVLLIHGYIPRPVAGAGAIVARVEMSKAPDGRYAWGARIEIPRISGGHGSLIELDVRMRRIFFVKGRKRSYLSARCPDGRLQIKVSRALFKNENKAPGVAPQTMLKGSLFVPCPPAGGRTARG
jgi:hypothetical protein